MLKAKTINSVFIFLFSIAILFKVYYGISVWIPMALLTSWLLLTIVGSFNIGLNYHLNSLHRNPDVDVNVVAITFDDGPNPSVTPKLLKLLNEHQAKATFFWVGKHLEAHPKLIEEIINQGHTIGNHTYSHSPYFGFFRTKKVVSELKKTNEIITNSIGKKPLLYRPIYGVTNPTIKKAVQILGLKSIGWSVRSLDTVLSERTVLKRLSKTKKGDIILLHEHSEKNLIILEWFLQFLKEQKLNSVTVDMLLNIEAYE